ncbi:MAG: hypothetical protein KC646_13115 [Candidatus Cloacimonetes bacterium]|nr:hypothetical protein [Candidatus Cloacimonadota bacterium]
MKRLLFPMAISMAISVTSAATHQDLQNEIAALRDMVLAQQDQIAALISQKDKAHKAHKKMSKKSGVKSKFKSKVGGYVKVATHFDDNGKNFTTAANDGVIGIGPVANHAAGTEEHTNSFTAAETRLNYSVWGPKWKGWDTKAFIEGHFYTGNFGLRHAFIDLKKDDKEILFGQYWSSFGSAKYIPETADFAVGIRSGGLFARNEQLRYSDRIGSSDFKWQVAIESDGATQTAATKTSNGHDLPFQVYSLEYNPKRKDARKAVYWHKVINTKAAIDILDGSREDNTLGAASTQEIGGWAFSTVFGVIEPKDGKKEGALTLAGSAFDGNGLSNWGQLAFGSTMAAGTKKAEASEGMHVQLDYYPKENLRLAISHGEVEASFEDGYSLTLGQMTKNERDVFSAIWQDNANLKYGIEYAKSSTTYQTAATTATDKENNRISLFAQYSF